MELYSGLAISVHFWLHYMCVHCVWNIITSQLTFDCIRREFLAHKHPRTQSIEDSSSTSTSTDLEVHSSTSKPNAFNLELVDPIDYDTNVGVSSPIWIDSTSNKDPSTDSTLLSSSVDHDLGAEAIRTVSKESAGNKNSNAVLATTCAGDIALSPTFPPVQPKFSTTTFSNQVRSFNLIWNDTYNWLEYSVEYDVYCCYPCRFFGSRNN